MEQEEIELVTLNITSSVVYGQNMRIMDHIIRPIGYEEVRQDFRCKVRIQQQSWPAATGFANQALGAKCSRRNGEKINNLALAILLLFFMST